MTATHADIRRTLVFLRDGDRILLAMKKRGFGHGRWNGLGGKLEPGETLEQAAVRECHEESGVTPRTLNLVAEHDFVQQSDAPEAWHMYVYVYLCESWDGTPVETEEMAPQWFTLNQIPYKDMWEDDEYWLARVLDGQLLKGTFTFDEHDRMTSHDVTQVERLD